MNQKTYSIIGILVLIALAAYLVFKVSRQPKIAYVKSSELIYGYLGMKDAQRDQAAAEEALRGRLDSLKQVVEQDFNAYNATYTAMGRDEQARRKESLLAQESFYKKYAVSIQEKIKQSDERLTSGVLNQVNAFVEQYGTDHGYDLVFGTTASGNILYAKNQLDITEAVLEALNKTYTPGFKK